jgi:hypothetical protein
MVDRSVPGGTRASRGPRVDLGRSAETGKLGAEVLRTRGRRIRWWPGTAWCMTTRTTSVLVSSSAAWSKW